MTPRIRIVLLVVVLIGTQNCTGLMELQGGSAKPPGSSSGPSGGPTQPTLPTPDDVGRCEKQTVETRAFLKRQLRRLSVRELKNTADAVTGVLNTFDPAALPPDPQVEGYDTDVPSLGFSSSYAESLLAVSEAFAVAALGKMNASCSGTDMSAACDSALQRFAELSFRRPLSSEEAQRARGVYERARTVGDHGFGIKMFLKYVFMSPSFQYRTEAGEPVADKPMYRLSGPELASALSYALTGGPPDDELALASKNQSLEGADELTRHANRLLLSDRGKLHLREAMHRWLQIKPAERLDEVIGKPSIGAVLHRQTNDFLDDLIRQDQPIAALVNSTALRADRTLADYYGVPEGNSDGSKVSRFGVLGQGAVLASNGTETETSLVFRGLFIARRLFCIPIGEPPPFPESTPEEKEKNAKLPIREQLAIHQQKGSFCSACHVKIDPLGFALEGFDHRGLARSMYPNGTAVDTSGVIAGTDVDGPVNGAAELVSKLSASLNAKSCFSLNMMQFAFGREQSNFDSCSALHMVGQPSDATMKRSLIRMVTSDWFLHRSK
jgi:hypothetical protein